MAVLHRLNRTFLLPVVASCYLTHLGFASSGVAQQLEPHAGQQISSEPSPSPTSLVKDAAGGALAVSTRDPSDTKENALDQELEDTDAELLLNAQEERLKHSRSFQVGLGETRPWQGLTLAMGLPIATDFFWGVMAGVGSQSRSGIVQSKTYDLSLKFTTVGMLARVYSQKFPHLSFEPSLSYTEWTGNVSPFGLDSDEAETEVLTGSIEASGVSLGTSLLATWFIREDISLDWTMIGIKKSWLFSHSNSRNSPWIDRVTSRVLSTQQIFGLTALTVGFWF